MLQVANLRNPVLINSIGHTAGMLLFGLILVMLIRDRRGYGLRQTRLSLMAAMLAFIRQRQWGLRNGYRMAITKK